MNTELSPEISRTCSKGHGKIGNNNRFTEITGHGRKQHQVAMFRARNKHATGT